MSIQICKDYQRGSCRREKCKFSHVMAPKVAKPGDVKDVVIPPSPRLLKEAKQRVPKGTALEKVPPKTQGDFKRVVEKLSADQFAKAIGNLHIELSSNEPNLKLMTSFCLERGWHFEVRDYYSVSESHHPVDGKLIRGVATKCAISSAIKVLAGNGHTGVMNIVDWCGSARTVKYLHEAAKATKREREAKALYTFTLIAGQYDAKDMLRSNQRSNFVKMPEIPVGTHIVIIQDVQQVSTSKEAIMKIMESTDVVSLIGHVESGPMGFNGYHGFYLKEGEGITNWASIDDSPYSDTESLEWVLRSSKHECPGFTVTWVVQYIYGNACFVVFAKTYLQLNQCSVERAQDFVVVDFEVTNQDTRGVSKFDPCSLFSGFYQNTGKALFAVKESGVVHMPTAFEGACFITGPTFGNGTDNRLDKFIIEQFAKDIRFAVLRRHRPAVYQALVIATTAYARRLEVERRYETARLGVASVGSIKKTNEWRGLTNPDSAFSRTCSCLPSLSCCIMMTAAPVCACGHLVRKVPCIKRLVRSRITGRNLPSSELPFGFVDAVTKSGDLGVNNQYPRVSKYGVHDFPKRTHTQTPIPLVRRLGPGGKVEMLTSAGKRLKEFTIEDFERYPNSEKTVMYGPFAVPWHANANCAGGAMGMLNALMTGVKLNDGSILTLEESARRGEKLNHMGFLTSGREFLPVYSDDDSKRNWVNNHVKRAVYAPALEKLLGRGGVPDSSYRQLLPKTNELLLKDKERIIIAGLPECPAYFGEEASILYDRLSTTFGIDNFDDVRFVGDKARGHFTWGSGTTARERGRWFEQASCVSANHFASTVCGDDVAMFINIGGAAYAVESDASNWDHCQVSAVFEDELIGMLNVGAKYFKEFGASDAFLRHLRCKTTYTWKAKYDSPEKLIITPGYDKRESGKENTTSENTIVMAHLVSNIASEIIDTYEDGTDALAWIQDNFERLGALCGVKLKAKVHLDPHEMMFLKGFYVPCLVDGRPGINWFPSIEILVKLGTSESDPRRDINYIRLQKMHKDVVDLPLKLRVYDILNGWAPFGDMPVWTALRLMIKAPIKTTYKDSRDRLYNLDKWDKPEVGDGRITNPDFGPMLATLGVTVEQVHEFTELCASTDWEPGMYIEHPLIATLAERYR